MRQLVYNAENRIWQGFYRIAFLHPDRRKKRMAKLDIDIVLLDESVVMHGFRALMSGGDLESFKQNPIMLLQHNRPKEFAGREEIMLPIGKWYDIRIDGSRLLAKPEFDDDDELAVKVQKKVQKGYLNGASVWIEPVKLSDDAKDMLPGQSLPTFIKWGLLEASIVDIPNCRNALAIRNSAGKKILLDAGETEDLKEYLKTFSTKQISMEKKLLAAKLGLDENTADNILSAKLDAVIGNAGKLAAVEAENTTLKTTVANLKKAADEKKITDLVDGAITAKKLAAGDRDKYIKLANADFDTTKELLDGMKAYESIETKLAAGSLGDVEKAELAELCKLSGHDLYLQGKLERLQKLSEPHFKSKYKEAFGVEYTA